MQSISTAVKLIGGKFAGAAAGCVEEAAHSCKSEIKHLNKFFKCAVSILILLPVFLPSRAKDRNSDLRFILYF